MYNSELIIKIEFEVKPLRKEQTYFYKTADQEFKKTTHFRISWSAKKGIFFEGKVVLKIR